MKFDGTQTISAAVSTANQRNLFGNQPFLENKKIVGVAVHLGQSKDMNNVATIGTTNVAAKTGSYVTFRDNNNKEFMNDYPLSMLDTIVENAGLDAIGSNPNAPFWFPVPMVVDFRNSYITIANTATVAAGEVVVFTFFYNNK